MKVSCFHDASWPGTSGSSWLANLFRVAVPMFAIAVAMCVQSVGVARAEDPPTFLTSWGDFSFPHGLGVDATGNVYVADTGHSKVQKFSSQGTLMGEWVPPPEIQGSFGQPYDVAPSADGHIYVSGGGAIAVLDDALNLQRYWIANPANSLALDPTGQFLYTTTYIYMYKYRISDGALVGSWQYAGNNQVSIGLAVGPSGTVYAGSDGYVQKFTADGAFLGHWQPTAGVGAIAVDAQEHIYMTTGADSVFKYTSDGTLLSGWHALGNSLVDIGLDANLNIYIMAYSTRNVLKYGYPAVPAVRKSWGSLKNLYRD